MDYALFKGHDMHYNRCYKLPNNKLALYGPEPEAGRIQLAAGEQKRVIIWPMVLHGPGEPGATTRRPAHHPPAGLV
jgi:hypothetical protein